MKWNNRNLVSNSGWPITSVTEQSPLDQFERYRDLCNANEVELERLSTEHEAFLKAGKPTSKQPEWSKQKERLLNKLAKEAGIVDS